MNAQQSNTISRRRFLGTAGFLATGLWLAPKNLFAFQEATSPVVTIINAAKTAKVTVTPLRKNISMLEGSGGNIAVLNGPEGKLMVDGGIGVSKANVLEALNSISANPVKFLINTHWHFDHTFGNEWLHGEGATIVAQDVTKKHLESTVRVDDWNYTFPPMPKAALPTMVYSKEHKMNFNGEAIHISTYKPSHTDGDSSVHFANADILHVADTFWNGYFPFVDYSTGGSIDGMIAASKQNIARAGKDTIVIPGHGPLGNKADLMEFHEMLVTVREKVASLKQAGKSLDEIIAAKPTEKYDAKYGGFVISGKMFTNLVYKGV
ncbi:Glyoxylase, beta-lactamase superfamily II [Mucilaginibacter gossypiicola]|uniref:Glyoxylase, beta-lactamase superfamily II n=1 Tax=Mucilaginibacter gossypiicola TaxID=551995 RepID=A0A1H8M5F1_9SPHI|nr:MBL fold metallo-hydrolase [Mucilaginibacter gossypiicola]SEO12551.1 Glyoxylase, beta-lactamase superfamily II [Mucilaginibacter gossypiicola]